MIKNFRLFFENPWGSEKPLGSKKTLDQSLQGFVESLFKSAKGSAGKHSNNDNSTGFSPVGIGLLVVLILSAWLATGFYTIDADEEGVVIRFGKYVRKATSGLNYRLPSPIETVEKVSVTRTNKESIGFRAPNNNISFSKIAGISSTQITDDPDNSIAKESQMLTGDQNIIDMHFYVEWVVKDAKDYLFNLKDDAVDNTVKISAESAMRQVIAMGKVYEALSEQRQEIESKAKKILQDILDSYSSGIKVVNLGILYCYVAPEVRDAYRDIQAAKAVNQAYAYRNDIIPRARGEAQGIIEEAKGYKEASISRAKGESERFTLVLTQYQRAKDVTKRRIYIETMEEIMRNVNKLVIDKKSNAVNLLPIQDLLKQQKAIDPK